MLRVPWCTQYILVVNQCRNTVLLTLNFMIRETHLIKTAWIKICVFFLNTGLSSPQLITRIKFNMVSYVFELTVKQNLHFFHRCICYLLLFIELCLNTPKYNQFDNVLLRVDFIHMP